MSNLRLRLARLLAPEGYTVDQTGTSPGKPEQRMGAVVESAQAPKWTPHQEGNVIVAEPKLVTMERATRGDAAVERDFEQL